MVYHCKLSQVVTFWFTTVSIHKLSHFTVFQNPKNSPKNQKNDFHILGYLTHFHDLYIYIANVKTDNSCEIISIFFSTVKTHYANIQNMHTICHCKGCFFEYLKNITNLDKKPNRLVSHILLPLRWNIGCWLWSKINLHIYIFNSKLMTS